MIFMNMENSKTNKRHKCVRNLSPKLDSKRLSKHVALQSLSFNHTWENIRQQYKKNKLRMITPTQNNEFELFDGSYSASDIQDYIAYIIKNMKRYPLIFQFIFTSTGLIIDSK